MTLNIASLRILKLSMMTFSLTNDIMTPSITAFRIMAIILTFGRGGL
jgi:hypothetical protein